MKKIILLFLCLAVSCMACAQSTCISPAGQISQNTQPPICYTIPSTDTVDICFTFTSPGSILYFPIPPSGMCSSIQASAVLYDSACNIVSSTAFGSFVFVDQGSSYVWCLHYVCDGTHNTHYCPYYFDFSALPVEWLYFKANYNEQFDFTRLYWSTASELNNSFFEVEHCVTGAQNGFSGIAPVARVPGNGTTNQVHTYNYTIGNPPKGLTLYRIKQLDYNGDYKFSNVVAVMKPEGEVVYWNVYDISGRFVGRFTENQLQLLSPGYYTLFAHEHVRKYIR